MRVKKSPILHPRRQAGGFALVELMIASFVLGMAFICLFSMARLGDWLNIQSRIQSRIGRETRHWSDFVTYAPYDRVATGELDSGYLYHPVDTKGRDTFTFYPDPTTTPYLDLFPYRAECNVQIMNEGQATEYKVISLQVYYTGQKSLVSNAAANEKLFYDNGGQLIRTKY